MNYLAHILLSGKDPSVRIGNFVGDAVKGKRYKQYPQGFQLGILLHRQIDAFSDAHPLVREAVALGREPFGRYSAVVTDILFDHFLGVHFREYSNQGLTVFAYRFYCSLIINYHHLPPRFQGFIWHFILTNRLACYASFKGIHRSLEIMAGYRGLPVNPDQAIDFLRANYGELENLFQSFFPELQAMCQRELVRLTTQMLSS